MLDTYDYRQYPNCKLIGGEVYFGGIYVGPQTKYVKIMIDVKTLELKETILRLNEEFNSVI